MSQERSYSWYVVGSRAAVTKTQTDAGLNKVEAYLSLLERGLGTGLGLLWKSLCGHSVPVSSVPKVLPDGGPLHLPSRCVCL